MRDAQDLDEIAAAVADGTPLDWARIERVAPDEQSRTIIRNLRAMAALAGLHRTLAADDDSDSQATLRAPIASVDRPLRMWGHFALEQHIGSGSFGDVYRAIDTRLDRIVAVKLARAELRDPDATLVEARLLARVRHSNVASVYGADVFDGQPGLWMEFIEGQTLSAVLARQGALSEAETAVIGLDLCRALAAVHAAGLLHRDIKAQNVMRESGGRIVLMDFGGGREMSTTRKLGGDTGTPLYLAPEIVRGHPASARSDVYALGVLLYHLVTRDFPIKAADALGFIAAHGSAKRVSVTERRPDVSPRFAAVIERATAAEPEQRFASAGEMASDLAAVLQPAREQMATVVPPAVHRQSRLLPAIAAVVLSGVVAFGGWRIWNGGRTAPIESILVLPLADESPEPGQEYLAAGFSNALSEDLGLIRSLRIITSSQARDGQVDRAAVARGVGADAYLEGAIKRSSDRIALSLRLVDTRSGALRWSGSFDRPAQDGLALNREVARAIARELSVAMAPEAERMLSTHVPISSGAQDAYLRGWAEYYRLSRDGVLEAARQFQRAIDLEPSFAAAHAALSYTYCQLGTSFKTMSREESRARAEAAALKALDLDPTLPQAYTALGQVRFLYDWNWAQVEELYRRALDLNPNIAQTHHQYGLLLSVLSRLEPALQEMRTARALDPDNVQRHAFVGIPLYYARRYSEAIAEVDRVIALDPNSPVARLAKARYLNDAGRPLDALAEIELARYRDEPAVTAEKARILTRAGRPDEARRALPELMAAADEGRLARDHLAFVHLALGEREEALALLEAALAERSQSLMWAHVDPRFDALRNEPRFTNLLRQMGFVQ